MSKTTPLTFSVYEEVMPRELSKSEKRRALILQAAIEVYADLGVTYVSSKDVARKAKTSAALVEYYFPEKYDLVLTTAKLVRGYFQKYVIEKIQAEHNPLHMFELYVRSTFEWASQHPTHIKFWAFFMYLCYGNERLRKEHLKFTEMGVERICQLLLAGEQQKVFKTKFEHTLVAKGVQNQITGALFQIYSEAGAKEATRIENHTWAFCLSLIDKTK